MIAFTLASLDSPLGTLRVVTDDADRLRALDFVDCDARLQRLLRLHYDDFALADGRPPPAVADAFGAYFAGAMRALDGLVVETGGTPFQRRVWQLLRTIPAGIAVGYGTLAARLGQPLAARAVGAANGSNPVAIVVPCHRVIGADGTLTGYAGGVARKRWLLEHEARWGAPRPEETRHDERGSGNGLPAAP